MRFTTRSCISEHACVHEVVEGQRHTVENQRHRWSQWTTVGTSHTFAQYPAHMHITYSTSYSLLVTLCSGKQDHKNISRLNTEDIELPPSILNLDTYYVMLVCICYGFMFAICLSVTSQWSNWLNGSSLFWQRNFCLTYRILCLRKYNYL